jgi:hypothetical protein
MKIEVSGSRDGQPWPKRGETLDVSDAEGAGLCSSGLAVPVADSDDDAQKAVPADDAEKRVLTTESAAAVTPGGDENKGSAPAKKAAAKRASAKPQGDTK